MPEYSPKVRRNQNSIETKHRKSNGSNQSLIVSDHIDKQRQSVLRLEEEKFWLDSEIQALRKQIHDIDDRINCERSKLAEDTVVRSEIARVTSEILLFCCNFVLNEDKSTGNSSNRTTAVLPGKDRTMDESSVGMRKGGPPEGTVAKLGAIGNTIDTSLPTQTQLCSAIIDSPPEGRNVDEYVAEYADLIRKALFLESSAVTVSGAVIDSQEKDALRVLLFLSREDALRLGDYIEELAGASPEGLPPTSKAIMRVTRAVIIDADPSSPSNKIVARRRVVEDSANALTAMAESGLPSPEPVVDPSSDAAFDVRSAREHVVESVKVVDTIERQVSPTVKELVESLERKGSSENGVVGPTAMSRSFFRRSNVSVNMQRTLDSLEEPPKVEPSASVSESAGLSSDMDGSDMDEGIANSIRTHNSSVRVEAPRKGWGLKALTPSRRSSIDDQSTKRFDTLVIDARIDPNVPDSAGNTSIHKSTGPSL